MNAFLSVIKYDLAMAFRRWSDLAMPLVFFVIVCTFFPLAVGQDKALLKAIGPGAIWVAALLATLLSKKAHQSISSAQMLSTTPVLRNF